MRLVYPNMVAASHSKVSHEKTFHEEKCNVWLQIDDLMESFHLSILGEAALSALAIEHNGFQLYPVGEDQEEQFQSLRTAGALVSSELMGLESDGSSD